MFLSAEDFSSKLLVLQANLTDGFKWHNPVSILAQAVQYNYLPVTEVVKILTKKYLKLNPGKLFSKHLQELSEEGKDAAYLPFLQPFLKEAVIQEKSLLTEDGVYTTFTNTYTPAADAADAAGDEEDNSYLFSSSGNSDSDDDKPAGIKPRNEKK